MSISLNEAFPQLKNPQVDCPYGVRVTAEDIPVTLTIVISRRFEEDKDGNVALKKHYVVELWAKDDLPSGKGEGNQLWAEMTFSSDDEDGIEMRDIIYSLGLNPEEKIWDLEEAE